MTVQNIAGDVRQTAAVSAAVPDLVAAAVNVAVEGAVGAAVKEEAHA